MIETTDSKPPANVENSAFGSAFGSPLNGAPFDSGLAAIAQQQTGVIENINGIDTLYRNIRGFLVSNFRQILSYAYAEIGLVQTLVDIPVDDGLRGGVKFKSQQLSEENIEELTIFMDDKDDLTHAGTAAKWNRLYGGSGIVVACEQDPFEPFELDEIKEGDEVDFIPADIWELFWSIVNPYPGLGGLDFHPGQDDEKPLPRETNSEHFDYYGHEVHKSRVFTMKGIVPPSFIRPRLRGWGMSVVDTLIRSLNQYIKGTDLLFEVLDEFKVDVYRFKNLANTLMSNAGATKIKERVAHMNFFKNYQNAVVLDAEDEFDHKQLSFSGLGDAMLQIRMQTAGDMRMPMTKLFGISAAGFNSGEDDIEVYNAMVESSIRRKLKRIVLMMAKIRCQQLFGMVPTDLQAEFEPLRMLSSEQLENVKTQKFTRSSAALAAGAITLEEFRDICNKGNLFDVKLDTDGAVISDLEDAAAEKDAAAEDGDDEDPEAGDKKAAGGKMKAKDAKPAKEAKEMANELRHKIRPWRAGASALRSALEIAPLGGFENSAAFDRASYEADGGDTWVHPKRAKFFDHTPVGADESLWSKAKAASVAAYGAERWQFTLWYFLKQGGNFSNAGDWDESKHPRADDGKFSKYSAESGVPDVIGKTSSGKDIHSYFEHPGHTGFSEKEHSEAAEAHEKTYKDLAAKWVERDTKEKRKSKEKRSSDITPEEVRRDVFETMQEIAAKHEDAAAATNKREVISQLVLKAIDAHKNGDMQMAKLHVIALKQMGVDQAEFTRLRDSLTKG